MKELGLIYFCVAWAAFLISIAIFSYKKYTKKILDTGSAQLDLRERKNKEITEGISMLASVYFKANELKVEENLLGRLPIKRRRIYDIVKNRNKVLKDGQENVWDEILQSTPEEFRGYISGNKSLYDILRLNKEGKKNSIFSKRLSRKIVPLDENSEDVVKNASFETPFVKTEEIVRDSEEHSTRILKNQKRPSFRQRVSMMIPTGVFKEVDVPISVRIKVKEYLENRHVKVKTRETSWFKKATSKKDFKSNIYIKFNKKIEL